MLIFYIDEVGNESLSPGSLTAHPWFLLGAMGIKDTSRVSLCEHLRRIKNRFFPGCSRGRWEDFEIKGRYLNAALRRGDQGRPPLEPSGYRGLSVVRCNQLIEALFNAWDKFRPVFYFIAVDKNEHLRRHPVDPFSPVAIAYAFLQMRVALLVEFVYGGDEGAVFLADEQHSHEKLFKQGEIVRVRDRYMGHVEYRPNMNLILDKPIWVNKGELEVDRENTQLIDFALWTVWDAIRLGKWSRNFWLAQLAPHLARHWTNGRVWNGGITILPRPVRYPQFRP